MACADLTTSPSHPNPSRQDNHLLVACLQVAHTAATRALRASRCPDVRHLVAHAEDNLAAARDLLRSDLDLAA